MPAVSPIQMTVTDGEQVSKEEGYAGSFTN